MPRTVTVPYPYTARPSQSENRMRRNNRADNALRPIRITRHYTRHAEGSVLIACGDTQVICTASVESKVPRWLKDRGHGWVTAEYGMLPRATGERMDREAARGKQSGRTLEIQRLIGRSLRAACNLNALNGFTLSVDCDVIQADGGTRTAAITGGFVALADAIDTLVAAGRLGVSAIIHPVAAVSVGVHQGRVLLDLCYEEDTAADVDMNVVMNDTGDFIEIQGTGEGATFNRDQLNAMLAHAGAGIDTLIDLQRQARKQHP